MDTTIALGEANDVRGIRALLEDSALPLAAIEDLLATTLVARQAGSIVGTAALELYADGALLRSVAVDKAMRGHNLGHRLTEAALRLASQRSLSAHYYG